MRVAVFVYGMYREFDRAVPSWKFINDLNCDVYVSSWNHSKQGRFNLYKTIIETDDYVEFDVDESMFRKHLPNAVIEIHDEKEYSGNPINTYKKFFHWKNCLRMMKESGKTYDLIMLVRTDLLIESFDYDRFLNFDYKDDEICGTGMMVILKVKPLHIRLHTDLLFYGKSDMISKMIENIPDSGVDCAHTDFAHYLYNLDIVATDTQDIIRHNLVRPEIKS